MCVGQGMGVLATKRDLQACRSRTMFMTSQVSNTPLEKVIENIARLEVGRPVRSLREN